MSRRELSQVAVVPRGMGTAVGVGLVRALVPSDAEPVTVGRRRTEPRVEALVDQRPIPLEQDLLERQG